jgi:hypothetical protein
MNRIDSNQNKPYRFEIKETYSYRIDSKDSSVEVGGVTRLYWTVDGTDGVDGGGRVEGGSWSVRSIGLIVIEL